MPPSGSTAAPASAAARRCTRPSRQQRESYNRDLRLKRIGMSPNTKYPNVPWPDPNFDENQSKFPLDELAKYEGQHIAWSWDGTRIVASGVDWDEVQSKVIAAGIDPQRV